MPGACLKTGWRPARSLSIAFRNLVFMWTGLLPVSHKQTGPPGFGPVLIFALPFTLVIVVLMMWVGQGGTRVVESAAAVSGTVLPVGDRTPDRYWKLGLFSSTSRLLSSSTRPAPRLACPLS